MGGGIARRELAAAVSEAGGLGTLGYLPGGALAKELAATRELTGRPVAVNLLLPFASRADREAAGEADAVVTFWGRPKRPGPKPWLHQVGSVEEAGQAHRAGADGVIVQGVEAGGHVRGTTPALDLLERVREVLPSGYPIWLAGGIAEQSELKQAIEGGAEAGVLGTRFLLSDESRAHPEYKLRLIEADATLLTELFGLGWPAAPHRVIENAATRRWTAKDRRGPGWVRLANRVASPLAARVPPKVQASLASLQSERAPLLAPQPATDDGPAGLVDSGPLYAGETVGRISQSRPAAEIVRGLTP